MPPKKSGGAKGATKGKGEDESKGASKEKKGGTAVKVIIHTAWWRTYFVYVYCNSCSARINVVAYL